MDNEWSQFEEVAPAESQAAPQTWQDFEEVPVEEPQSQPQPEQQPGRFESLSAETWSRLKHLNNSMLKSPSPQGSLAMGAYEVAKSGVKAGIGAVTGGLGALNAGTAQPPAHESVAREDYETGRPEFRFGAVKPQEVIEQSAQDWNDPPETEVGKALQDAVSYPFEWWEEQAYDIAYGAGEPNQTLGATGAYTALMFLPAVVGMATGAGIGAGRRIKGTPKAPHSKTLRAEASELYRKADEAKGGVLAQSYDGVLEAIVKKLTDEGYDPGLHPKTAAALNNLQSKAGNNQTLKGVEINRRVINNARGSIEASDARMAGEMLDVYDDWMRSLKAKDMLMGNTDAVPLYQQAREVWSRKMKADELEWAIERASQRSNANYSGANFETALRQEFKSILLNKKRRRMFSPDEIKAIEAVSQGDFGTNLLRLMGKLAPSRGVISAAPGGALMYTGEPMLGATLWAAGEVGKKGSQVMTKKRAYDALDRVARSPETR